MNLHLRSVGLSQSVKVVGRYELHEAFASGGMAAVHFARMKGEAGFSRTVAVKRLHPSFSEDANIVSTLLDEARLASRIQHPNVVATLDVVVDRQEILLVLEYVHGEALSRLLRSATELPDIRIVTSILSGALHGLHAAHEAKSAAGEPLGIVHRDVSPQNILVGVDGLARVLDFGIAKARGRLQTTREGQVKGKLAYMAPEQIRQGAVTVRTDVFAAGIVLWEALTGKRLFAGENEGQIVLNVLESAIAAPSTLRAEIPPALDAIVMKALERDPDARFETAHAFALALEDLGLFAPPSAIGRWVSTVAEKDLRTRASRVEAIESTRGGAHVVADSADETTKTEHSAVVESPPQVARRSQTTLWWFAAALAIGAGVATVGGLLASRGEKIPEARVEGASPPATETAATAQTSAPAAVEAAASSSDPTESAEAGSSTTAGVAKRGFVRSPTSAKPSAQPVPSASAEKGKFYRFE